MFAFLAPSLMAQRPHSLARERTGPLCVAAVAAALLHVACARPLLRLTSTWVTHAAHSLTCGVGVVAPVVAAGANDGLVDTDGQRGVDVPMLGRTRSFSCLRKVHSSDDLSSLGPRPGLDEKAPPVLRRGKWWVMAVAGSDHCLGTALAGEQSGRMYADVFALLERLLPAPHHRHC